jgi:hypothetical protein
MKGRTYKCGIYYKSQIWPSPSQIAEQSRPNVAQLIDIYVHAAGSEFIDKAGL